MAVDPAYLIETKLAHLLVVGLTLVGAIGLVTTPTFWFWIGYFLVWILFVDLFDDDFLSRLFDSLSDDSTTTADATTRDSATTDRREGVAESDDPITTLKQRYAAGDLDDDDFERKLDRLLAIDDLDDRQLRELVREQ